MRGSKVYAFFSMALMASPLLAQSNYPMPIKRDSYNDWVVECFEPNEFGQECQIYQRLLINGGSAIAMVATMAYDPADASLLMQFALPLGINIENGVIINIDEDIELPVPISRCTKQGCIFEGVATPGLRDALVEGKTASITVVDPASQPFVIPLSLAGFGDALERLQPEVANGLPSVDNTIDLADENSLATEQVLNNEVPTALETELPSSQASGAIAQPVEDEEADDTLRPVTGTSRKP